MGDGMAKTYDVNGTTVRLTEKGLAAVERAKAETGKDVDVDAFLNPVRQGNAVLTSRGYSMAFEVVKEVRDG